MANWLHRTTKRQLQSIASADLPEAQANYIKQPDLTAVVGQPISYWLITGDVVSLMSQSQRDVVNAQLLSDSRDALIENEVDELESMTRAFALVVRDEINRHAAKINEILGAISVANNLSQVKDNIGAISTLPPRTLSQLRDAMLNKLGQ